MQHPYGFIFIGGGLSSTLAAYTWLQLGYDKPILIIEQNDHLCGNHTWSFNQTDILIPAWNTLYPLIDASWKEYQVKFPKIERTVSIPYHTLFSNSLSAKIQFYANKNPLLHILTGQKATILQRGSIQSNPVIITQDKKEYSAEWIIQSTGQNTIDSDTAYQKFVGIEVSLKSDANLSNPIVMDATVPQKDGFRFMYILPFTPTNLLIEDTYYSLNSKLDVPTIITEIKNYAQNKNWQINTIDRQEKGVLPIPLSQKKPAPITDKVLPLGMHANLFHVTTGYSLATNYNFIWQIYPHLKDKHLHILWHKKLLEFYQSMRFYRVMNHFLFIAGKTNKRYRFLEVFYQRQKESEIARFYAGTNTLQDKIRIFSGKAPFKPSIYLLQSLLGRRKET
ncbi:MAG: lycopene beta-cyclase CrtY [Bacteroidia bacterium]|nr:lycopene beta-cyclase CrtY [Bacteroidia bacterium]MDW8345978.1 lycopene beta-cyclase CrtY [Bacteroidia bacterium]